MAPTSTNRCMIGNSTMVLVSKAKVDIGEKAIVRSHRRVCPSGLSSSVPRLYSHHCDSRRRERLLIDGPWLRFWRRALWPASLWGQTSGAGGSRFEGGYHASQSPGISPSSRRRRGRWARGLGAAGAGGDQATDQRHRL